MADYVFTQNGDNNVQIVDKSGVEHERDCLREQIAALRAELDALKIELQDAQRYIYGAALEGGQQ